MTSIMDLINESNDIMLESTNMMIELQSAFYLEDLIFEYSIIENFDNKNKKVVLEAVNNERKSKLKEVISNLCKRIVDIIGRFIEVLQNKFMQTEKFVEKYGRDKIEDAIRNCNKKLADGIDIYNPIGLAFSQIKFLQERIKIEKIETEEDIYTALKVKDKEHLEKTIEDWFINKRDADITISRVNAALAVSYLTKGRECIDLLRKTQKSITNDANRIISEIQRSEDPDPTKIAACKTAMSIKLFIVKEGINHINNGLVLHAKIAKASMSYKYLSKNDENK